MQEPSQTRHYGIYRGCTAVTKAIYTLTQQGWSVHLLTKLAGWFKQDPEPEVWAALLPCIRCSSTLSQFPEQPVERKCMKVASKHSYMRNIRASGISQPTGKKKFLTLKSSQWYHFTAVLRQSCPACYAKPTSTEEGSELSISQGGLTLDSLTWEPEKQRFLWPHPHHPCQPIPSMILAPLVPPWLCHGRKSWLVAINALIYHSLQSVKCVLYIS